MADLSLTLLGPFAAVVDGEPVTGFPAAKVRALLAYLAVEAQREALFYILSGQDQPVGTMFQIFSVVIETIKDPIFAKIDFDWDLDKRRARIEVAGVVRAHSEPIRNPVTDREEQMILVLPKGWVFHEAENASGFAKGLGAIKFDLNGRHSSLAHIAWNQNGLLHTYDEYKSKFGRP